MHPGAVLKELRTAKGLTQVALARRSGVSNQFISDLEHGRALPSAEVVVRLARGLAMDPGDLLKRLFPDTSRVVGQGRTGQSTDRDAASQEAKAA